METPPPEPIVRRTRSALAEIPARMMGIVTPSENRLNTNNNNNVENILTNLHVDINQLNIIPNTYMSPAPSPDELVIQARGRRRIPPWSPNASYRSSIKRGGESPKKDRTPVKSDILSSPNKSTIVLRSTPRKRLLMCDVEAGSPERKPHSSPKRMKLETITVPPAQGPLENSLKALSHEQLIKVILGAAQKDPDIEEEIKANLPAPDLKPIADKLNSLRKNIFKCLPNSRLMSKTDSPAYNRASTHVLIFKKAVLEAGRNIISSQQWEAVISYIIISWEQTSATPLWENQSHNVPRKQCFKYLASQCMIALKKLVSLTPQEADRLLLKLKGFLKDSEEITHCVKYLETMIENLN